MANKEVEAETTDIPSLEKSYSEKLSRLAELEQEVKALKAEAAKDEAELLAALDAAGGEGKIYHVVEEPVKFESSEWWKKYDKKSYAAYYVESTIHKFSLDLLKKKAPKIYEAATKLTIKTLKAK